MQLLRDVEQKGEKSQAAEGETMVGYNEKFAENSVGQGHNLTLDIALFLSEKLDSGPPEVFFRLDMFMIS